MVILYKIDPLINQKFGYLIARYYKPALKSLLVKRSRFKRVLYLSQLLKTIFSKIIKKRKSAYFLCKTFSRIIKIYIKILYKAFKLIR